MKIAVLPGDAIGPEITAVTVKVLRHLNQLFSLDLELNELPVGLNSLQQHGSTLTPQTIEAVRRADGVILAPVSTYEYPPTDAGGVNPSGTLRTTLDLYANIRPARNYAGVPAMGVGVDLVVVRENTEGFYADRNMFQGIGEFMPSEDMALSIRKITRSSCERIARRACELALRRRQHLTVVHKASVLRVSDGLFKTVVFEVASQHPELQVDEMLIDAMAAALIRRPQDFDVIVTSNMYGDILSDMAVELTGGLGLGGALNMGDEHAIAQATHGSAPDIAGCNLANPTALLLSTAMLLRWLGGRHGNEALGKASEALESGLEQVLENPTERTADLGGSLGTEEFGNAVIAHL